MVTVKLIVDPAGKGMSAEIGTGKVKGVGVPFKDSVCVLVPMTPADVESVT